MGREFITLLGGAGAWPIIARAQQGQRMPRIGVLSALEADNPEGLARMTAFVQALAQLGWVDGRNVRITYRLGGGPERMRRHAAELVALAPDVVLANGTSGLGPMLAATRTVPIVFVQVSDAVGVGYVASLARPGGNGTGFAIYDYAMSGRRLELLKQIAPGISRSIVLRDHTQTAGIAQLGALHSIAPSLGVEIRPVGVSDPSEIERGITTFARGTGGGLILTSGAQGIRYGERIIALAARYRLPAIYPYRFLAAEGGLLSYAADSVEPYRQGAAYVDRILKGEKPDDLPVQQPTKFDLVINLKTARTLGLDVPATLLARADEVIE